MNLLKLLFFSASLMLLSGCDPSASGETRPPINNVFIDPESPEFIESDYQHFGSALPGVWKAADCRQEQDLSLQTESAQSVFVFTFTELVETEYLYSSTDCTGAPVSKWYPLPIRSWSLGEYRTLADGSDVWELNTSITQRGVYGGVVDSEVGTTSFVNIAFVNGDLEFNDLVQNTASTRPSTRSGVLYTRVPDNTSPAITNNDLIGEWFSSCSGTLESTYEIFADTMVITDENWADVGCTGESYAIRRSTFDLVYGDAFTSIFKDNLIEITLTAVTNELVKFDASQGLDSPEFKVPEGNTEFRALTTDGSTIILGYCLYRNNGEDNCQDSEARTPDMVDYNWKVRFDKVN